MVYNHNRGHLLRRRYLDGISERSILMKPMRVLELQVENYVGVKAVLIKPEKDVVRIEGKNRQGKSSVINAIWTAVGGKTEEPVKAIRRGLKDARIFVDLGEINVTRKFTGKGSYLEVKNSDGLSFSKPQEVLDRLFSKVSMDPQEFISMKNKDRLDFLLELTGKREEIEKIEDNRKTVFENRTGVNREIKILKGKLEGVPDHGDIKEKSVSALLNQLNEERRNDKIFADMEDEINQEDQNIHDNAEHIVRIKDEIKALQEQIKQTGAEIADSRQHRDDMAKKFKYREESKADDIQAELETAEYHNAKFREMEKNKGLRKELSDKEKESAVFSDKLVKHETNLKSILQNSSKFKDLSIVNDIIYVGETPFDDLSDSEKIRVSMQIGISQNPTLRVLRISHGGELDSDTMKIIESFAAKNNCQIWVQKVCDEPQEGIFIKDGEVFND